MRRYSIAIAFQLCWRVCHSEGSGKPACLEIKQYTSPLVYAADSTLGRSLHNKGNHTEALVVASNETGQEVNSDKTRSYLKIKIQDEDTI
jgi:hypothetical protein